jgi:hypothetical protein
MKLMIEQQWNSGRWIIAIERCGLFGKYWDWVEGYDTKGDAEAAVARALNPQVSYYDIPLNTFQRGA